MKYFPCPLCGHAVLRLPGHEILLDTVYADCGELPELVARGVFDWTHSVCLKETGIGRPWSRGYANLQLGELLYQDQDGFLFFNRALNEVSSWYNVGYSLLWNMDELPTSIAHDGGVLLRQHANISVPLPQDPGFIGECEEKLRSQGLALSRLLSILGISEFYGRHSPIANGKIVPLKSAFEDTFASLKEGFLDAVAEYDVWIPDSHVHRVICVRE